MKRLLSFLLCSIFVLSCASFAAAASNKLSVKRSAHKTVNTKIAKHKRKAKKVSKFTKDKSQVLKTRQLQQIQKENTLNNKTYAVPEDPADVHPSSQF